jgi:hypothetical protein
VQQVQIQDLDTRIDTEVEGLSDDIDTVSDDVQKLQLAIDNNISPEIDANKASIQDLEEDVSRLDTTGKDSLVCTGQHEGMWGGGRGQNEFGRSQLYICKAPGWADSKGKLWSRVVLLLYQPSTISNNQPIHLAVIARRRDALQQRGKSAGNLQRCHVGGIVRPAPRPCARLSRAVLRSHSASGRLQARQRKILGLHTGLCNRA